MLSLDVSYFCAPIPDRSMDWAACVDGREEWLTGRGATRQAAVDDLLEQIEEEELPQRCCLPLSHGGSHMFVYTKRAEPMAGECPARPTEVK